MKDTAIDTNILIYAHVGDFPEHPQVRHAVEKLLVDRSQRVVLTVGILHEFLHVVTDPRRFRSPLTMRDATSLVRSYLSRTNVLLVTTEETDLLNALDLVDEHGLGRDRLGDTVLAAVLRRHSVRSLWTRNQRDFKIFRFLNTEDPSRP